MIWYGVLFDLGGWPKEKSRFVLLRKKCVEKALPLLFFQSHKRQPRERAPSLSFWRMMTCSFSLAENSHCQSVDK